MPREKGQKYKLILLFSPGGGPRASIRDITSASDEQCINTTDAAGARQCNFEEPISCGLGYSEKALELQGVTITTSTYRLHFGAYVCCSFTTFATEEQSQSASSSLHSPYIELASIPGRLCPSTFSYLIVLSLSISLTINYSNASYYE